MFARYYIELPLSAGDVERALTRAPESWVPGLAREADGRGTRLLAEVGFGEHARVERNVEIELGAPVRMAQKTLLPIRWKAADSPGLFPSLEADLEVAPIGPRRTQLAISARYVPPFGAVGRAMDRALLHRVAEATLKDFVDGVGAAVLGKVAS